MWSLKPNNQPRKRLSSLSRHTMKETIRKRGIMWYNSLYSETNKDLVEIDGYMHFSLIYSLLYIRNEYIFLQSPYIAKMKTDVL